VIQPDFDHLLSFVRYLLMTFTDYSVPGRLSPGAPNERTIVYCSLVIMALFMLRITSTLHSEQLALKSGISTFFPLRLLAHLKEPSAVRDPNVSSPTKDPP
jgi:hypothetical protein